MENISSSNNDYAKVMYIVFQYQYIVISFLVKHRHDDICQFSQIQIGTLQIAYIRALNTRILCANKHRTHYLF